MLLRRYLEQGLSKSALARKLGISRDTIYRWIRNGELDRDLDHEGVRYRTRPPVPHKLDPYKPMILARLAAYPKLSAIRLFEEVRAAGYPGGYTRLRDYVREVRPRPLPEPAVRFETPSAQQAQGDFAQVRLPWGVRYGLLVVLGYSRLLWVRFYARQDVHTLFLGLEAAFRFFGGVPREILFDQMKAVVTQDLRLEGGRRTAARQRQPGDPGSFRNARRPLPVVCTIPLALTCGTNPNAALPGCRSRYYPLRCLLTADQLHGAARTRFSACGQ